MWSAITTDAVLSEFTANEAAAIQRIQGVNSLASVLKRVVQKVRDSIRAGGYNLDPDPAKIPEGLHDDAIDLARWRLLISVPSLKAMQTQDRSDAAKEAMKQLRLVAAQKWAPEEPALPGDPPPISPGGSWDSQNKLIMRTAPTPRPAVQQQTDENQYSNPNAPADLGD